MTLLEQSVREILTQKIAEHHANCDCLLCRKDGKINQATAKICKLIQAHHKSDTKLAQILLDCWNHKIKPHDVYYYLTGIK